MATDAQPDHDAEVEGLFALVRDRYGDRLTHAQLDDVKKGVEGTVRLARALRAVKLQNADEPFPPFVPYRRRP
jgi:hypothetical protein